MASIQGVYLALFGRPADPVGLAYFNGITGNGSNLAGIADLSSQPEYLNRFTGQTTTQIVLSIYKSLFNRLGDDSGVAFFVNQLATGKQTINTIAINILDGAQNADLTLVNKKLAAADLYTKALDTPAEISAYSGTPAAIKGAEFLTAVTASSPVLTAADIDAAVKKMVTEVSLPGVTINLVSAGDQVSPSQADPAFKSTAGDDTVNAKAGTFTSATKIDSGAGTDTVFAFNATGTTATPTLTNTEKLYVTQTVADGIIDLANSTGLAEVWNKQSTFGITFNNLSLGTKLGVTDTDAPTVFDFKDADVAGSSDEITLTIKGTGVVNRAGATSRIDAGIEKVNLVVQGDAAMSLYGAFKTVVVTGEGNVQLYTDLTTRVLDASGLNGALSMSNKFNGAPSTDGIKIIGSKFGDNVQLKLNGKTDTIVFNDKSLSTFSLKDTYLGFNSNNEDKIDLTFYGFKTGITTVTTFTNTPALGTSFGGNVIANLGSDTYVDINKDGVFNPATDLVFSAGGGLDATDFIF